MKPHYCISLLLGAIMFFSCSDKNAIHVFNKNFIDEIDPHQTLVITIDKDIAPDSIIERWMDEPLLTIEPQVKGKYKFSSPRDIVFSPEQGFAANTEYTINFSENILKFTHKKYTITKKTQFKIHTPSFVLSSAAASWAADTNNIDYPFIKVNMHFTYEVNPSDLAASLKMECAGKTYPYKLVQTESSNEFTAIINDVTNLEGNKMTITVGAGLKPFGATTGIDKPLINEITIPEKGVLEIQDVRTDIDGSNGIIHVYTSQQVWGRTLTGNYSLTPKKETTLTITDFGFDLSGEFNPGETYELKINTNVRGVVGGKLKEEYKNNILFGDLSPGISFPNKKAVYLTSKGSKTIAVNITNIKKVTVKIFKIYENNITRFMQSTSNYYSEYENAYSYYGDLEDMGDVIYEKEFETSNLPKYRNMRMLQLNTDERQMYKGIYYVQVKGSDSYYQRATKLVSMSDIGLIVKQGRDHVLICANSIATAQAMPGVKINLISNNNQTMTTVTTNGDGVAMVKDLAKLAPGFRLAMVTADNGGDFNYMYLNNARTDLSRFEVAGMNENATGLQAFIYGDRDLYRPGETIHFNTVVRNAKWDPVPDLPIKIKILLPNGNEFQNVRKNLNAQGAVTTDFMTSAGSVTGVYTIEVYTGNDVLLQSKSINIEEFMPDRIKVVLSTDKENYKQNENIDFKIQADNLFGTPATNRSYKTQTTFSLKYFSSKKFPDYNFYIHHDKTFSSIESEGKTDDRGSATQKIAIPDYEDMGVLQARVFATVFDENGRPVNRVKNLDVFTQEVFFGIHLTDYYYDTQKPMTLQVVGVDKAGEAKASAANVIIIRHEFYNVIEHSGDYTRYVSKSMDNTVYDKQVNISGETPITFTPTVSGEYEIRVRRDGSDTYISQYFYCYGWGYTDNNSFEVNNEGNIDVVFDKEKYTSGDKAHVLLKTPFAGKILVTVERNNVFDYFILQSDKKSAQLDIPIKDDYLPNIYVSATLFRAVDDQSAMPLTVAHGYASALVEKTSNKINVSINVVEKSRSNTKQTIQVKTNQPNAEITIAAVDEGILQIKNFQTPDPYNFFYAKRALEVGSFDMYPYLFPEYSRKAATGGDGYDLKNRTNPLPNKRVQLVSFWSGILHTDASGNVSYTVDIPQFSGDLRVMAVVYKNKSFGNAEKHVKVADPIVLSASLPRFCSPGDQVNMYVTMSNTTSKEASVKVSVAADGALEAVDATQQNITIGANQESVVFFKVNAKNMIGNGKVRVVASAIGEQFVNETQLTVRPAASLQKRSDMGMLGAGTNTTVDLNDNFITQTRTARLVVSKNPVMAIGKHVKYLLGYPHGCVEQTVSKAFPQIYFAEISKTIYGTTSQLKTGENELNPKYNVQQAIRKLELMQLSNGGLTYWMGGDYECWWGSVYAAHFLVEAQKAGYDVNNGMLNRLFDYLNDKLKNKETEEYWYYKNGAMYKTRFVKRENIYALYVLALSGKARVATMNYYKQNKELLNQDERYMLACSYFYSGDKNSYNQLLPQKFEDDYSAYAWGGSFYSPIRNEALALNCLVDADMNNTQVTGMIRHLIQQIKNREYLNTQEAAFAFLALGKISTKVNATKASANITRDGKTIASFTGNDVTIGTANAFGKVNIQVSGEGALYYFFESEGITADGSFRQEDSHLQVRRNFLNQYGQDIGNKVKQNDLVVVKITIKGDANDIENVVITDMLPAGFEIENSRITETNELPWLKNQDYPMYTDVRDDRINLYTTVTTSTRTYYYLCRAVTKGTFILGPVSADAMYNYDYRSYFGSGKMIVE